MSGEFSVAGEGFRARFARPEDSAALCELFRSVHLGGALDVTQERDPDFFAMLRMHLGELDVVVVEDDGGSVVGCSTMIRRPGWLGAEPVTTGYFCDLRVRPGFRGGRMMPAVYGAAMDWVREKHGAEVFTTVIFDDNRRAKAALVRGGDHEDKRAALPAYRVMTPFRMTSVQFTTKKPPPERRVSPAGPADWDELCAFLIARQRRRVLGERLDEDLLKRRLATWPGFELGDFLLARDGKGRLAGCLAPWDTGAFKRTRVVGYHGRMAWIRRGFDVAARLRGFPPLPPPGECFRFWFLTHLEIRDDDPRILRDLLREAYRRYEGRGAHFLSAMIPRGSRLEAAFEGFMVNRTAMTVYAVHAKDSRYRDVDFTTLHPGFEMALS
jgi:RimJ/RimL family protein N-acetyltransferase